MPISLHGLVNMAELSFTCTMCDVKTETEQEIKVHILDTHLKKHLTNSWPCFKGISMENTTIKAENKGSVRSNSFQDFQSSKTDAIKETHGNKSSPNADTVFQINDLTLHSPTHPDWSMFHLRRVSNWCFSLPLQPVPQHGLW